MELHDIGTLCFEMVYSIFYILFGVYAIVRLRRSKKSSTESTSPRGAYLVYPAMYTSATMSRYFFYFLPFHCLARLQEIFLRTFLSTLITNGSVKEAQNIATIYVAIPALTMIMTLYLYLRVWVLQTQELDPSVTPTAYKSISVHVAIWFLVIFFVVGLDQTLEFYQIESHMYASYCALCLMFLGVSVAFFYFGSHMHRAVSLLYGVSDDGTFESHILRVKWLFGVSCLTRVVYNVLEVQTFPWLLTDDYVFMSYVCVVELVPLAAALLSMAIVERRMNAMNPALVQEEERSRGGFQDPNPGYNHFFPFVQKN